MTQMASENIDLNQRKTEVENHLIQNSQINSESFPSIMLVCVMQSNFISRSELEKLIHFMRPWNERLAEITGEQEYV